MSHGQGDGQGDLVLDFLDLDKICEPRSQETRDEIYMAARERIPEIVAECKEFGLLSKDLKELV